MGKFTGLLLASDYDNTLTYTEEALRLCTPMPPVSDANQAALRHFMAEGGIFSVATGRAKPAFEAVAHGVPMNGPTILFNGAAIYDFAAICTPHFCRISSGPTSPRPSGRCPLPRWSCTTTTTVSTPSSPTR